MSGWYCDDKRKHEREAQEDARYGSHSHQPDRWDDEACYRVYSDAYHAEEYRQAQRAAEEEQEQRRLMREAEARDHQRFLAQQEEDERYRQEEEDSYRAAQEQAQVAQEEQPLPTPPTP